MILNLQLEEKLYRQFAELAKQQGAETSDLLRSFVEDYVSQNARASKIDQIADRLLEENAWLFKELENR